MKRLLLAAFVPFAIAMGCEGGDSDGTTGSTIDNDGNGSTEDPTLQSGLVVAKAPGGFTGDFTFTEPLGPLWVFKTCEDTASCEAFYYGAMTVNFECPSHLFVPKVMVADPKKDQEVTWDNPGDWGLAPNGTYHDVEGDSDVEILTWVKDGEILLAEENIGSVIGKIIGNTFSWTPQKGTKHSGSITDDLRTITYHVVAVNGNEADRTLILVE